MNIRVAIATAILALLWTACGGKVVVDAEETITGGAGGSGGESGVGTTSGISTTGGVGSTGGAPACDLCKLPSTCETNQDCCGFPCSNGHCFFSPPAGLLCCTDEQCPSGTTCDLTIEACRGCTSDAQCFGVNPTCDVDAGLCH